MNARLLTSAVALLCAMPCALALALHQPNADPLTRPRTPRPTPVNVRNADIEIREMVEGSATMSFDYKEDIPGEPAEEPKRGGGGIAGKINEIAEMISADQGKPDTTDTASLRVRVIPVLKREGEAFAVTLRVVQEHYAVGSDLPAESRAGVEADRGAVMTRLAQWRRVLTPEQVTTLKEAGAINLGVRERFSLQRLRSRDQPVVTVYLLEDVEADVVDVTFLVRTRSGVQRTRTLIYGCVTVAEVTLDRAPEKDEPIAVRVSAAGRAIDLVAVPTGQGSTTLRTEPFVPVVPQAVEGLEPPSIPSQPGDVRLGIP